MAIDLNAPDLDRERPRRWSDVIDAVMPISAPGWTPGGGGDPGPVGPSTGLAASEGGRAGSTAGALSGVISAALAAAGIPGLVMSPTVMDLMMDAMGVGVHNPDVSLSVSPAGELTTEGVAPSGIPGVVGVGTGVAGTAPGQTSTHGPAPTGLGNTSGPSATGPSTGPGGVAGPDTGVSSVGGPGSGGGAGAGAGAGSAGGPGGEAPHRGGYIAGDMGGPKRTVQATLEEGEFVVPKGAMAERMRGMHPELTKRGTTLTKTPSREERVARFERMHGGKAF